MEDYDASRNERVSRTSSIMSLARASSLGPGVRRHNERIFNLDEVKQKVFDKLHTKRKIQKRFHEFYNSSVYDEICRALLVYFVAKLEFLAIENGRMKGQEQGKMEAIQQVMGHKSISQLQNEMKSKLQDLCPLYARVLMQYSNYSNLVTDKNFFETFYDAISTTMQLSLEVPNSLSYKREIERDLGHIFRTPYFNIGAREEEMDKLVDTLTIRDLYKLRHETDQTTMNQKMVSALYERPRMHHMHESYGARSDMICFLLQKPNSPERERSRPPRGADASPPRRLEEQSSEMNARAAVRNALGLEQEAQPRVLLLGYHEVCQLEFVYRSLMGLLTSGRKQSMAGPVHRQSTMRDRALTRGVSTAIPVPAQAMPANLGGAAPTLGPPFKLDPQSGLTFTLDPARAKGVSMA